MIPLRCRQRRESDLKALQQLRERERELENELELEREERQREQTALAEDKSTDEQKIAEVRNLDDAACLPDRFRKYVFEK